MGVLYCLCTTDGAGGWSSW